MDQRIIDLKSTAFSDRRVNRRQIADIQETAGLFPDDSRNELAKTVCEHPGWKTAKGACRVGACLGMLETLESHGILRLPPMREGSVRDMKAAGAPAWTSASDPQPEIAAPLAEGFIYFAETRHPTCHRNLTPAVPFRRRAEQVREPPSLAWPRHSVD